ncbi:hypothetical protein BCR39DRAFT_312352 [Naematelia encephala]|uniref:MPN domain-containing protein n=1 Tax=Naematelia encephala TaxID=71784 RepID=A0A1Y2AQL3_9TREE|nr:hypothetical protein BCR39DRAFT_312352 [Naematelia encephala]
MSLDAASSALQLNLPPSSSSQGRAPAKITVHPSVIASMLTHHSRRPIESTTPRVIGTLMGTRSENGLEVDVRTAFVVPHSEDEEKVALDMPFNQTMVDLLNRNGAKEQVVGWYATHPTLNGYSALIQNVFNQETLPYPAIHLTIDTDITSSGQGLGVKGYVSTTVGLTAKAENCAFLPVPVAIKFAQSERAALDLLTTHPTPSPALPALPALASTLTSLSDLIDQSLAYVTSITSGENTNPDVQVGRHLLEGVGRWPAAVNELGVPEGLQDTLTVSYLSNLVRSQVELGGRLGLVAQAQQ